MLRDAVWWRFVGNVLLGFRWMPNSSCKWTNLKTIRRLLAVQLSMQEWIIWPKAAATGVVNSSWKQKLTNANHLWIWKEGQPIGSLLHNATQLKSKLRYRKWQQQAILRKHKPQHKVAFRQFRVWQQQKWQKLKMKNTVKGTCPQCKSQVANLCADIRRAHLMYATIPV